MAKGILKWILPVSALLVTLLISLVLYKIITQPSDKANTNPPAFLTTSSPSGAYTLYLTGGKERPSLLTNTVRFSVLKNGKPFLTDKYLHSGDSMDLSFEMGYPNHRWINESSIQFYREENFNASEPDTLVIANNTGQVIKYIKIESEDKLLLFDLQPGAVTKLLNSRPRGDFKWVDVVGEFPDGRSISGNHVNLPVRKNRSGPSTYYIYINNDHTIVEIPPEASLEQRHLRLTP